MRYAVGARAEGAGSATLPIGSLYAASTGGFAVREIGVFNTTTTAFVVGLVRLTTAGTRGTALTESKMHPYASAAIAAGYNTHTVGPTLGDDLGYRATIAAATGAGVIWTFGAEGLVCQSSDNYGIGIYVPTGTGQVSDFYIVWDE